MGRPGAGKYGPVGQKFMSELFVACRSCMSFKNPHHSRKMFLHFFLDFCAIFFARQVYQHEICVSELVLSLYLMPFSTHGFRGFGARYFFEDTYLKRDPNSYAALFHFSTSIIDEYQGKISNLFAHCGSAGTCRWHQTSHLC